jgi:hypothetical protein
MNASKTRVICMYACMHACIDGNNKLKETHECKQNACTMHVCMRMHACGWADVCDACMHVDGRMYVMPMHARMWMDGWMYAVLCCACGCWTYARVLSMHGTLCGAC